MQLLECVPNISEGRDKQIISQINKSILSVSDVHILHTDIGFSANRTVLTIVGPPEKVIEGVFRGVREANRLIDMGRHRGEHPRMGAVDVCPFIPLYNLSVEELIPLIEGLGKRIGEELSIPVYLYEKSAKKDKRKNLASIRSGEYEGFCEKIMKDEWKPDYGPQSFNAQFGQMAMGVRHFLVAYNINLNTLDPKRAHQIACDVRESGQVKKVGTTDILNQEKSAKSMHRLKGRRKGVKAIGWFMEEFGIAQVSMNLVDLKQTDLHEAFEAVCKAANERGLRVTGSELVGMVPLKSMLRAGHFYLKKQKSSVRSSEEVFIKIATESLGLSTLKPFRPEEKIIEYKLRVLNIL